MSRYTPSASWYDALSAEPIYRVGRERAIPALRLREGSRVLNIGCGNGLNFPCLLAAVGRRGQVVGVDRSHEMLVVARRKAIQAPPGNVALVEADAEPLDDVAAGLDGSGATFDAVLFTYSLSVMSNWESAWIRAAPRPGPAARLACRLGGADINSRPWTLLERTAQQCGRSAHVASAAGMPAGRSTGSHGRSTHRHHPTGGHDDHRRRHQHPTTSRTSPVRAASMGAVAGVIALLGYGTFLVEHLIFGLFLGLILLKGANREH